MARIKADKLDQARAYILARNHVALSAWIAENMPVGVDLVATAKMFDLLLKSDNDMHMSRAKKLFEILVDTYNPAAIRVGATVAVSWWLLKVAAVFGILYLVISH